MTEAAESGSLQRQEITQNHSFTQHPGKISVAASFLTSICLTCFCRPLRSQYHSTHSNGLPCLPLLLSRSMQVSCLHTHTAGITDRRKLVFLQWLSAYLCIILLSSLFSARLSNPLEDYSTCSCIRQISSLSCRVFLSLSPGGPHHSWSAVPKTGSWLYNWTEQKADFASFFFF